jgi:hypothetical protein
MAPATPRNVRFQVLKATNTKMLSGMLLGGVVWQKITDVSELLTACIITAITLMIDVVTHL